MCCVVFQKDHPLGVYRSTTEERCPEAAGEAPDTERLQAAQTRPLQSE